MALLAGLLVISSAGVAVGGTATQDSWHREQVRVDEAQDAGHGGSGVTVAVLDSWVDRTHPDFEGRVLPGADCLDGTCAPGPARSDACDHGTHVSGIVAASSFGIAPAAQVLPVRVLAHDAATGECTGRPEDVAAGLRWAVARGARVVNLSLGPDAPGLSSSPAISAAVEAAARAGVLVVFSAGNSGRPVADAYGDDAVVVAATGPDGRLASYSQRGRGVTLAAPGGDPASDGVCDRQDCVTSLFPGARYSVAAGTSMAAPHVSGVAALLLGQDPARSREQVLDRLLSTARPVRDAGHGLVDAGAALGLDPAHQAGPDGAGSTAPTAVLAPTPARAVAGPPPREQDEAAAGPTGAGQGPLPTALTAVTVLLIVVGLARWDRARRAR